MPELPEVEALAHDLRTRLADRAIVRVDIAAFSALKTFDPPLSALEGTFVEDVTRHGKFLDISTGGLHLILHLARAGWVRWRDEVPKLPPKPSNKSPLAARVVLDDDSGLDITEAGTKKSLAVYVARSPRTSRESPGWGRIRWRATSPSRYWRRSSATPGARRSRACCAIRARSQASATPTATRSCTQPG